MISQLEEEFHAKMLNIYFEVGDQTHYWAKRYKQKVIKDGGLIAAKSWLRPQIKRLSGLDRLASLNRLDLSFESLVLQEPWSQLFTFSELQVARRRLNDVAGLIIPEEAENTLYEGAKRQILVNVYERNAEARRRCIAYYGVICSVCEEKLSDKYGEIAVGFIHVHHIRPLASIGKEYDIDPIKDLRPVCPNCHSIIHLGGQTRSIEEVKRLLTGSFEL